MMTAGTEFVASAPQVDAGVLSVGHADSRSWTTARPVILLLGWPYDIHSYADVTALLASDEGAA